MASDNRKVSHLLDEQKSCFKLTALARAVKAIGKRRQNSPHKQIKFESLEPRVLLSADPFSAALASTLGEDWSQQSETQELSTDALAYLSPVLESASLETGWDRGAIDPYGETLVLGRSLAEFLVESGTDNWIVDASATQAQRHVAFVDSRVEGYESLLDNILPVADSEGGSVPVIEVVLLDADRDGVEQIEEYLANQQGISAVHVLAHGSEGSLSLGSAILDAASLDQYSAQLGGWGNALTVDADILLYGCNIASGEWGAEFVRNFAVLTGADVAASDDATGNALLGGDWDLELQIGSIEAQGVGSFLDVGQLTGLLQDGVVVSVSGSVSGIFSGYAKDDAIAGGILDLRNVTNPLKWTIGADGQITIESDNGTLKVKDVTILKAGSGQNDFIILNNAEFGSNSQSASIIGNGSSTTLSFTPNLANPDALFTSNRVTSGINNVDLDSATDVINFGKVWFTATSITKVVGGKGNDEFDGGDAQSSILVGGRGDDTLIGGSQPGDLLKGGVGDDTLIGGLGSDFLEGGGDDDHLYGALKDASLATPETGTDSLAGGKGDDTYYFLGNWGTDEVDEQSGEGTDTMDFTDLNAPLNVEVGVSIYNFTDGVKVSQSDNAANTAEASNVEVVKLGEGANTIVVNDNYGATSGNRLTISNALRTTQTVTDDALAKLDLSNLNTGVEITIEAFTYKTDIGGTPVTNPNGNKVTVTFESGAKLIVFNVESIDGTDKNDKVTFKDGAVLDGTLDLGDGSNEVIVNGDVSRIFGSIFGGDGFDLLRIGSGVTTLDSLTTEDEAKIASISDVIKKLKGLADTDTLDLDALYGVQLSTNPTGILPFDTLAFDAVIADKGGKTGVAIIAGDSRSFDVNTVVGKSDLLQGGSRDDILFGGMYEGTIKGGDGDDIIVAGSGTEEIRGESGADVYVFSGNWGQDTIKPGFTEDAEDTLDFSTVDESITYVLRAGKIYVGTGDTATFDYNTKQFTTAENTVTVAGTQNLGNNIGVIKISGGANQASQKQVFEFGNDWERTTIDVPAGTDPNLVLDFSRVYETLRFDFKSDGSLVVTQLGGKLDQVKDLIPGKSKSVTITSVGANTKIITGSNENIYRSGGAAKFDGELVMTGGPQKFRVPFTERFVDSGLLLGDVEHTIDLGESLGGAAQTAQTFWNNLFPGGDAGRDIAAAGQTIINAVSSRINFVSLAGQGGRTPLSFLPDSWFSDALTGLEYEKFTAENGAEIDNVYLNGLALNVVIGDLLLPGDRGDNTFTTKQFQPAVNVLSGLTGADTYEFNNFWGLGVVLEVPDLNLGIPLPESTDTLSFSGVYGQDIIVDVYDSIAAAGDQFTDLLNGLGIDVSDFLSSFTASDGSIISTNVVIARSILPGTDTTTSFVVANDIESLVGPSALGTMTVRLHGDASLRGTVAPGAKGDVILDYSQYTGGSVDTRLETLNLVTLGDFGLTNLGVDLFFDLIDVDSPLPESTSGRATGVDGNRFGGLTTIFDFFASLESDQQKGLLEDFGVGTVTKVIGSPQADTHMLSSAAKEYVLGKGDALLAPTPFDFFGIPVPDALTPDITTIGETTLRFDGSAADGVNLNLATGELLIDGTMSSVLAPSNATTGDFIYKIYSGPGDDMIVGSSIVDTIIFEGDWGHDTIDLMSGKTSGVVDVLDFSRVLFELSPSIDADGNLVISKTDGNSSVTIIGGLDVAGLIEWFGIDDIVRGIGALAIDSLGGSLLAAQPSALTTLDVASIESLVAEAMQVFDGKTFIPFGETDPVNLSFVDTASDGSAVSHLVRVDTGAIVLDASTLSFTVANLASTELSTRDSAGAITVDTTAADNGWYTGAADPASDETGVDLLSVLVHEIGLKLGIDPSLTFMSALLDAGARVDVAGDVTADDLGTQVDTTVPIQTALEVASLPAGAITASDDLSGNLAEAINRWSLQQFSIAGTPWVDPTSVLTGITIVVDDLDGDELARTLENGDIILDYTAAGHGWYTGAADPATGETGVDLLTVLMHELGHKLGVDHTNATGSALMSTEIGPGERRGIPGGTIVLFPLVADDVTALDDGLGAFSTWAGALGKNLDDYLAGTNIPFTDKTITQLLGISSSAEDLVLAATSGLQAAVSAALADGSPSAADILAIDGSTGTDYTFTIDKAPNTNPNAFVATFDLLPGGAPTSGFDLSSLQLENVDLGFSVDTDLQLSINADLQLVVEFGLDQDDTFYVRSPELLAELEITSGDAGFGATVSLGPIGLSVVGGSIDVTASTRLSAGGFINTAGLLANVVDPALIDPETNANYAIDLPIQLSGGLSGVTTDDVAIRASGILPTGAGDLPAFLQGMDIQFQNFDQLFQLRGISLDALLNGIVTVIDGLVGANQDGLLYKTIPGINQSIAELLSEQLGLNGADVLGKIKDEIVKVQEEQSLTGVEDALNGIFNDLFGAGTDPVTIRLEDSVLILDLEFEKLIADITQSFDLDLATFASELGLDDLIGAENVAAIGDKLKIEGDTVNLFADILFGFNIGVGLDLRNVLDPEQIISSDTGIFVKLDAGFRDPVSFDVELDVSDIDLASVLDIVGFDALPDLNTVGFGVDDATADLDLLLEFGLPDTPDGFYDIDAVPAAEIRASGQAAVDLPLVIGSFPIGGSDLDNDGDGINDNVLHVGATFTDGDFDFEFASPGMDKLISLAGFLNDPENIIKGLDKIFEVLEDKVSGQLSSLDLPFIGGALSGAQGFFDDGIDDAGTDLRDKVIGKIKELQARPGNEDATTIDLVAQALIEGLNEFLPANAADALGVTLGGDFVEFNLQLDGTLFSKEVLIDLGIPGDLLTFGPDGKVLIDLGYTFAFGFGFSINDGFYLNTDGATEGGEEFLLDLSATVAGIELIGELPILQVAIKDLTGDADDNDDLASGIFGSFSIDLQDVGNDGKLTIGEGATVEARLVAEANVDLGLTVAIPSPDSDSPLFPTITTTFRYDQILADIGTSGSTIAVTPTVVFEDVELNLGEFISGFVQPIIDVVSVATEPLEPLVDFLNEPITLLMDLFGSDDEITLLTIAQDLADSGIIESSKVESAVKFIGALSDIVNIVGDVEDFVASAGDDPILINFGSFTVSGGAAQPDVDNPSAPADQAGSADPGAGNLVAGFSEGGFRFPLLTDPSTIFGLLLGESVDLFIYDLPALGLDFNYVKSFPIYPGLNARFGGAISASTNIGFGFDTSGFNAWKGGGFLATDIPLIFDGLFLDDHVTFDDDGNIISDDPEATVSATIIAGASVGVPGLVEAGVDGGITGGLEFDLNDLPNENTGPGTPVPAEYDGKLRGRELLARFQQTDELFPGFIIPCVFDINGTVSFGLDAFFWIGIDLGFFGKATIFEARTTFLSGVLASFDFSCPDPEPASLANVNETTGEVSLIANMADGAFTVARETVEVDDVPQEFLVIRTGASFQYIEYDKVSKLVFNGTEGNDQIVIGAGLDGIELHIDGKGGNDRIAVASGGLAATRVFIRGGEDNDEIVVAETVLGNLDIDGGAGNDNIMVSSDGSNTILIHGGSGNDKILGSEYADTIYGDGGRDVLLGLGGADIIYGGDLDQAALDAEIAALPAGALPPSVDDLIYGGDDDDQIFGGSGNDRLLGEGGNDTLHGEDGDDSLTGGVDIDVLMGGADRDTIVWSYGDGEDSLWDGGDGFTLESDKLVDTVQISGVVFDSTGATIATDDTVSFSQDGVTDDVAVNWARTGVPGSDNAFSLTNIERISIDLGSGNDELTVNDLDQTTIESLSVDFGTTETITTAIVNAGTENEEEFLVRNVATDSGTDVLNLFGSGDKDIFEVESTTTGLLISQSKGTGVSSRNILDVSIFNPGSSTDRLNIDTGDNDDIIDASAVFRNDLTAIGFTAGADQDIVIGSPFIDDIDSGTGDDKVTGGAGVDLFTDASGDDKLFEARDVNYTLSDVELVVETLEVGTVVLNTAGEPEVRDENGNLLPGTVAVRQPDGSIKVTRAVTGVEVEDISGIFEEVYLTGASLSEGIDGAFSVNVFNVADFTGDAFLNGSAAADIYNIQLSGGAAATFTSFIDIIDDGGADNAGIDVLNIEGTNEADTFRFDKDIVERISGAEDGMFSRVENFSTDIIKRPKGDLDPNISVQTVNYLTTEDMVIHGRGGDDLFVVDDSSTELFVYGDSGDDSFFIGSVLKTRMVPNPNGSGMIEVVDRDGGLTNGVSFPAMFYGGKGNDYFEVNHNIAEISLFGQDGDDIFFLKALLTTEPSSTDNYQAQEDINVYSEAGESDTLAYVNNAPVNIFGGEGFDTLVIVGTVIDDTFVIFTEFDVDLGRMVQRIYGAGLVVPVIDSIERIQLITGAGDDTVYLYGTLDDQEILINTGGGNDIVQIGGDEFSFDVTIPESQYTKVNFIPQPDLLDLVVDITPARTWYTIGYEKLFGFFGPAWIPKLIRNFTPEQRNPRIVRTPQADLEVPEVVTVPEFNLEITVPESRNLESISGPVFIDGQLADGGDDAIVVDNRNGLTSNPGVLQETTVEAADINTTDAEVAAAKLVLVGAVPAGVDADVVYGSVVSYLEDQNRVRQQGLLDHMLDNQGDTTPVDLRPGQRIQAFNNLVDLKSYLPASATQGSYTEVNSVTGITETKTFSISSLLLSGGNEFLPDDVFTVNVGGTLGVVEVELLYDVNGDLTGANVFAEIPLTFDLGNNFVQSKTVDTDSTRIYDALSGFGLGVGIFYENFSLIDLQLSNDHDVLTINDTTADAVTNVYAGGGDDRIEVNDTGGILNIFGDVAGSDTAGLGIISGVAGTYSEDFTDADNAAAIGQVLGLGGSFDADNVNHIRALIKVLNVEFPATVSVPDPDSTIFNEINLDVFSFRAQIWELLKSEVNTLLGETSDYRSFLGGAGAFANFSTDLGNYVGVAAAFNPSSQAHLAALAAKVNVKNFSLTVEIDLAGNANNLSRDLDVYSSFVSLLLGPDGLNIAEDATIDDYRNFLPELGVALQLGQDFDVNNRSHLQFLASLVNNKRFDSTVTIDVNGTAAELNAALETFQGFVWRTLKEDLQRANSTPYNPLAETGDYRTQLTRLGSILSLPGAFDADGVNDVKLLGARLNDQFNDLGIDVDGIRLESNIDLGQYELEIWKLITEVNPLIEVPAGNDTFNVLQSGAEIFIWGQRGNDTVNLNDAGLGAWLTALGQQGDDDFNVYNLSDLTTESDRGDGRGVISDSVDFDGGSGLDEYYVDLTGGSTDYRINVLDTGVGGEDTLTIEGTSAADTFLMRRVTELPGYAADSPAFVALLHGTIEEILANESTRPDTYERINYDANIDGFLRVNGLAGDDYFASDDNSTTTILDGGADKDTFQIGQVYRTARVDDSVNPEDAFSTIQTTRGYLSRGVSYETQIIGGTEDDRIVVYSNAAELTLEGNGGNDSFEVRAFELAGGGFSTDSGTDINTGDGDDTVQYNVNAPVNIDGGTGFDTIVVLGTESNDNFVVTAGAIYGAGLFVSYSGAESIQIDGLEGDDTFFILSTAENVLTTVIGGLGSDTFNVGGDVTEAITSAGWDEGDNVQQRTLTEILGPLVIEGHYLEGANRSLSAPVMLPGEISEAIADGDVLGFLGTGESSALDVMQVATTAVAAGLNRENGSSDLQDLIGLTLEITDGSGEGRFWSIQGITDNLDGTVQLSLRNPSVLESAGIADIGVPDTSSSFAVSQLNPSFFAIEAEQVDTLNVFNDGSVVDDTGTLAAIDVNNSLVTLEAALNLSGLGMGTGFVADLGTTDTGDDITFAGGITADDLEILEILLGQGNDTLTIEDTLRNPENHGGITIVHGGGNTLTGTGEMGGDTIIVNGGGGAASPLVVYGDTSQDGSRYAGTQDATPETLANSFSNAGNDTIDARNASETVTLYGGEGDDEIWGGSAGDNLAGGSGNDEIHGQGGTDLIYGDSGINVDSLTRLMTVPTVDTSTNPNKDDLAVGNDTLHGDGGEDVIFGDHGAVTQVDPAAALWTTAHSAIDRIESVVIGEGGDDIIYGGDQADILIGGSNTLNGARGGDAIDGGNDDDLIFGDNVVLEHRAAGGGRTADPRLRTLDGAEIYVTGGPDDGEVAPNSSVNSGHPQVTATWAEYLITDLNHSASIETAGDRNFGDDYIAGGADDDTIFGQLGDDVIQGDGSIGDGINARVGASRDQSSGALLLDPSVEAATDGDDYIEGNGGNDVIFGNLGQDDIVGGSSSLFTLVDADLRPDGSDILFGGSGQRVERNYQVPVGDDANPDTIVLGSLHAEDSDAIVGDNANIYRLVGTNGSDTGTFLSFQYDAGRGAESIIVRAVDLIDYTPGGSDYDPVNASSDIGAGDEIHGGSGDDFIYGMKGSDLLFGDSEDDDLIGGYGNDWISGGAGSDGVLGDDGRIYTSRNTQSTFAGQMAEPLYGIAALAQTDLEISTPGNAQQAIINISGTLKKTANLTPFNVDPLEDNLYRAQDADDIIFGGLGNDFLHGGSGDDAISGAEAIASGFAVSYPDNGTSDANRTDGTVISFGFDNPMNPGNILGYSGLRAGEFAAYDEFNPRHRIVSETGEEYFLNFSTSEGEEVEAGIFSDGDDVIFGDLGNDWLVGGTGQDNMYGGRGDDLLNADDDQSTSGGLNDAPDTSDSYADRAFGGAGRDVLIANTGADRLIDWAGEFNTYLVPFGPFGAPTISRALPPRLFDFLYDLSASDGADPTRAADEGSDGERNGEPFGEIGLVIQKDFDWQDQTGAPDDPQPGNIPGGSRDVVRQATFNQGTADSFLPDVGDWSVSGSRLQVSPENLGGDAVSVYYADVVLPTYFEMQATIQGGKPTGGLKSNAYLIFDYQSPTDFKFAGVNISTDKLEMGHRDESGWHIDVSTNAKLRPSTDYNLLLALNGTAATLVVNNKDVLNFAFEARVDPDGYSYGFNSGMVGIGAFNSVASIDNVKLQVLPRDVEMIRESDFDSGPVDFLTGDSVGQWQIANGYLVGDGSANGLTTAWGGQIAYTTSDVRIAAEQVVEIEATLEAGATGGIIFDQYGETDFKFVYIDESGLVSIGHQTGQRWDIEASAQMPNQVKGDYDIRVALVGTTVSVIIDNQTVVSYAYNALTGDGAIGLLAASSNSRFDNIKISTNDPDYLDANTGDALRAAGAATSTPGITLEDGVNLQPLLDASVERWSSWLGRTLPGADGLSIWITDLPDDLLGLTVGDVIYVDSDAAGRGWFVDETPKYDNEFDAAGNALAGTDAANGVDLLSVIAHEVGHVLGYDHDTLQTSTLSVGTRLVPEIRDIGDEPLHRTTEISSDLLKSLIDVSKRIVPVNLGMFGSVHRQIPWAFSDDASLADSDLRAMMWNEEAGEFETAKPVKPARIADDRPEIMEFLEETGDWIR